MKRIILSSLLLSSLSLLPSCGNGNGNTNNDTATVGEKIDMAADSVKAAANNVVNPNPDEDFLKDVSKANAHEILMLQDGIDKGTNKELKAHAKMMLADHKKVDADLKAYAAKKNFVLPTDTPDPDDITAAAGKDWDKAWVDEMVDGHDKTINRFEKAQTDVKDDELKTWIMNTLPTLRHHMDMVKGLQDKMK